MPRESPQIMAEQPPSRGDNTRKDPEEWTTGDEPMTGAQRSYLKTLSDEAGEAFDDTLTKAEASKRIDELQQRTGRRPSDPSPPDPAVEGQVTGE